jgi:hypothetical protein
MAARKRGRKPATAAQVVAAADNAPMTFREDPAVLLEGPGRWSYEDDRPLHERILMDGDALKPDKLRATLAYLALAIEGPAPEPEGGENGEDEG